MAIKSPRRCGLPGNHLINNRDTNRLQHIVSFLVEKKQQQLQKRDFRVVTNFSTLTISVLVLRIFFFKYKSASLHMNTSC